MLKEDVMMFITVGNEYKIFENNGETIGKIVNSSDTAMVVQRSDNTKKIISFENILSIDENLEKTKEAIVETGANNNYARVDEENKKLKDATNIITITNPYSNMDEELNLSSFLSSLIDGVTLEKYKDKELFDMKYVSDGRYIGDSEKAKEDIERIKNKLENAYTKEKSAEYYLLMSRIAYDSREHSGKQKISSECIYSLLGMALIELGDLRIIEATGIDSARSYYIEALKILPDIEKENITKALNLLVYTFFVDTNSLRKEIEGEGVSENIYLCKYYSNIKEYQANIREFILATFLLYDGKVGDLVEKIKNSVVENPQLMRYVLTDMAGIMKVSEDDLDKDFSDVWDDAYKEYDSQIRKLKETCGLCASELDLDDLLKDRIDIIEGIKNSELLFGIDDDYVGDFIKAITQLGVIRKEPNVTKRIEGYRDLHRQIESFFKNFNTAPSEWSYSALKGPNMDLRDKIHNKIVELCNSTEPSITMSLQENEVLVNRKAVSVEIVFKNSENCQKADGIDIDVTFNDFEIRQDKPDTFDSLDGGESDSYVARYRLPDNILKQGQFKITVNLKYSYRVDFMHLAENQITKEFDIIFVNKPFEPIDNMYAKIVNGTGLKDCPEMFKGRRELINKLCATMDLGNGKMNTNRGIVLWGQRRVGKNSVKDNFKDELKRLYPDAYIHIDVGSLGIITTAHFKNLLVVIANATENEIRRHYKDLYIKYTEVGLKELKKQIKQDDNYTIAFGEYISELMSVITSEFGPYKFIPLFYIDEFTYCYQWILEGKLDGKSFMQFLKSFISDYGICAIFLAQDSMPVWKSEYPNEFNCMDFDNMISFLDRNGTEELVCEPCMIDGKSRFDDDTVDYIYKLTKGSAFLIDILCNQIIEYLNETKTEEYVKKYTVENVLNSWLEGEKDFFDESFFEAQYQDTSKIGEDAKKVENANKDILSEISEHTIRREFVNKAELKFFQNYDIEFANEVFERLVKRKIIVVDGDDCKLYMPLLKFMFLKKKGLIEKDDLEFVE